MACSHSSKQSQYTITPSFIKLFDEIQGLLPKAVMGSDLDPGGVGPYCPRLAPDSEKWKVRCNNDRCPVGKVSTSNYYQ